MPSGFLARLLHFKYLHDKQKSSKWSFPVTASVWWGRKMMRDLTGWIYAKVPWVFPTGGGRNGTSGNTDSREVDVLVVLFSYIGDDDDDEQYLYIALQLKVSKVIYRGENQINNRDSQKVTRYKTEIRSIL